MDATDAEPAARPAPPRALGFSAVVAVLVGNMVGTGVFTSLGFQARDLHTPLALLLLWVVGGLAACCGALAYAELGAALPRSGGEYVYLGRAFHPFAGFLGGWVSMTAGFAAPIALAGIAFGRYAAAVVPGVRPLPASLALVAAAAALHAGRLTAGRRVQVALTGVNLLLIAAFVAAGVARGAEPVPLAPTAEVWREAASPNFAVSLIYVGYAYSGWNAAGYVAGEIRDPARNIPRALVTGTAVVTAAYVLLNYTFLRVVPLGELPGVVEVGALAARRALGPAGGVVASALIALLLVATVSGMLLAGSRVTQAVAADLGGARGLGRRAAGGAPRNAVLLQAALVGALLLTNSFERVMAYAGFTLVLSSALAVAGVFALRWREPALPRPYRTWGYPVTPALYLLVSGWTLAFVLAERPAESLLGLATVLAGAPVWWLARRRRAGELPV